MNPKSETIYRYLLESVAQKHIRPGDRLPTESAVAELFGGSRMDASRAMRQFAEDGFCISRKRAGTFLVSQDCTRRAAELLCAQSGRVCVFYAQSSRHIHWDDSSFRALEQSLSGRYVCIYRHLPATTEENRTDHREELKALLDDAEVASCAAVVLFPDTEVEALIHVHYDLFLQMPCPVYRLNRGNVHSMSGLYSSVAVDHGGDGAMLGRLLGENGFRRIVVVGQPWSETCHWYHERVYGLGLGGRCSGAEMLTLCEQSYTDFSEAFALMTSPECVMVPLNNEIAARVVDYGRSRKKRSGVDYMVATFDDNPLYRAYDLTSLVVPTAAIGTLFGELVLSGASGSKRTLWVGSDIVVRGSCPLKIAR